MRRNKSENRAHVDTRPVSDTWPVRLVRTCSSPRSAYSARRSNIRCFIHGPILSGRVSAMGRTILLRCIHRTLLLHSVRILRHRERRTSRTGREHDGLGRRVATEQLDVHMAAHTVSSFVSYRVTTHKLLRLDSTPTPFDTLFVICSRVDDEARAFNLQSYCDDCECRGS